MDAGDLARRRLRSSFGAAREAARSSVFRRLRRGFGAAREAARSSVFRRLRRGFGAAREAARSFVFRRLRSSFGAAREAGRSSVVRSRATLRDRVHRLRAGLILAVQAGIAAGLAWYISHDLLGHIQPFFAPIAAVVVLAVSVGQRMRRAFEIVAGNAVGILLGEAMILIIGRGAWQVGLAVLLAILIAIFVGGTAPLITQAASSASLVATLIPPQDDYFFSRFIDAVVGGGVGLTVMALLLPLNPLTVVGRAANPVLTALAAGLTDTAKALSDKDLPLANAALSRLRDAEAQLRGFNDALTAGREIATVAPMRWRKRGALAQYVDSYNHVARALRNSRVLVRRSVSVLHDDEPIPPSLPAAVHSLADAVSWLRRELSEGAEPLASRAAAIRAVRACAEAYLAGLGFSGGVVVAQIRSTASDLITASGLSPEEAHRLVRKAVGRAAPRGRDTP